jgi:ubiquitin carboxyl-terminal hydrolase 8
MLNLNQIHEWNKKFISKIKTENKQETLYLINQEIFVSSNHLGNLNSKILDRQNIIDKENNFVIINEEIWKMIKKSFPNEKEIKIEGRYDNQKYVFRIDRYTYYFYFVNDNKELNEGYIKGDNSNTASRIASELISININEFINKFHINKNSNSQQKINESNHFFYFRLKSKNTNKQNNNNNHNQIKNVGNFVNNIKNVNNNINNFNKNNGHNHQNNGQLALFQNKNNHINNMRINNNNIHMQQNNQIGMNNFFNFNNINQQNKINNNIFNQFNPNLINNINNMNNNIPKQKRFHSAKKQRIKNSPFLIPKNSAAGLDNIGATCYMNATLQCLAHIEKFCKYLLNPENIQNIQKNKFKYKLTNAYLIVLINLWQNINIQSYAPHNFKQVISDMNPLFQGVQANDSKDLIIFLLENMHNELNVPINNQQNNDMINQFDFNEALKTFKNFFINNYRSVISNLFYGFFDSTMVCKKCGVMTHNIQCYNILIFPLEEVRIFKNRIQNIVTIEECFEYYQKKDKMSGSNQIYCNKCKSMVDSINYSKLITCPNILILNLNRGKGLQFNIKIEIQEKLNVGNFLYFKNSNEIPTNYELIGIVTHFGPSDMSGHFIAFCKSFVDNNWYKYNDSIVTLSSFMEAKNTGVPYILFYTGSRN